MIEVGGLVEMVRKRRLVSDSGNLTRKYKTVEIPKENRRVGHVLKISNRVGQVTVWCEKGIKYWFMKNCEPI